MDLKLGIYIEHGESNYFSMRVRELYKSQLCGLCGNYDDNPDDDWRTGPGCADAGPGLLVRKTTQLKLRKRQIFDGFGI